MRSGAGCDRDGHSLSERRACPRPGRWLASALLALTLLAAPDRANAAGLDLRRIESGLPASGQWRNGFDLADVDGDGRLDLVHGPQRKGDGTPRLFLGLGDLKFAPWSGTRFPDLPLDYGDVAAADFNGDGSVDLALAVHLSGMTVVSHGGGGAFEAGGRGLELAEPGKGLFSSRAIEVVDWNADGRPDLVAFGEGAGAGPEGPRGFAVFLNLGSDGWRRLEGPEDRGFGDSLAILDVDRDGRPDALVAPRRMGDRTLIRRQIEAGGWTLETLDAARADSYFPAVAVVDPGTDTARPTIALSFVQRHDKGWRSGVDILRQTASGWEATELATDGDAPEVRGLAVGDLNGDGYTDLATANQRGEVRVYLGREAAGFKRLRSKELERAGDGCSAYAARITDLDGDGRAELVLAFAGETTRSRCPTGGSLQVWTAGPGT